MESKCNGVDIKLVSDAHMKTKVRIVKLNRGPKFGKRHGQMLLIFLLVLVAYLMRVMMSISIVAMTDPKSSSNPNVPTYSWTNKSVILSAFFWGYVIPQVLAGWMANRYGPKWLLIGTGVIGSLVGMVIPTAAQCFGSEGVIACRIIQGICQGFIYPSAHYLLSEWTPLSERSRFSSFVYGGSPVGIVISMFVSGLIASSSYGWPMIFYTFSGTGLLWCIIFGYFGYKSPNVHPTISEEERNFICSDNGVTNLKKKNTPWWEMFTSLPVWALVLTQCGFVWTYTLMLTEVPNYMNKVLNFDMKKNTYLSPLPHTVFWILCFVMSYFADLSINRKVLSLESSRKVFTSIGFVIPSIAYIFLGNCDSSKPILTYILLVIAVGGSAGAKAGFFVNQLDIAPNYAGPLMGIVNGFSNIFSILVTTACQYFVKNESDPAGWRTIFYLSSGIGFISCLIFLVFGSGQTQPWNEIKSLEEDRKEEVLMAPRRYSLK